MKRILLNESGTFYKINIVFCAELSETNCPTPNCPRRIVLRRIVREPDVYVSMHAIDLRVLETTSGTWKTVSLIRLMNSIRYTPGKLRYGQGVVDKMMHRSIKLTPGIVERSTLHPVKGAAVVVKI